MLERLPRFSILQVSIKHLASEMLPPSLNWLNAEFVEKVLKSSENDDTIAVKNLVIAIVTSDGNHYFSDIIRTGVEYSRGRPDDCKALKKISLIIKVSPILEDARKKLISDARVFDIEIRMMGTLVKMNKLLNEDGYRLNARALYTENGDPSLLVLEDLASLGYRMADRQVGLDLDHCILVMRGLARFHASSVALYEKDSKVAEYTRGVFHSNIPQQLEKFFTNGLTVFANEILDWPELGSRSSSFSEKILKLSEGFYKKGFECYKSKADEFNVLNHGDCWSSNMLFRYNDEGKVVSHIFVDFQMCCWSTPLMDILLFMNSSMTEDVELNHHDVLLDEYLENLTRTMSRIGCKTKAPDKSLFTMIQPQHEILSIIASCVGLPVMFLSSSKPKSVDKIYDQSDGFDTTVYKEPAYRRRMLRRLYAWEANGVFDV